MHRVFISYHHRNDQEYKDYLVQYGRTHQIFQDWSVDTGEIPETWDNQKIRRVIRDDYLRSSTVTLLLVGTDTAGRKHVDWELKSSMINGMNNKKSGILVVNLPSIGCTFFTATHEDEKTRLYPDVGSWTSIDQRSKYDERYPYMPARIVDNLLKPEARISVVNWDKFISSPEIVEFLVRCTSASRESNVYDLTRPMRRNNSRRRDIRPQRPLTA